LLRKAGRYAGRCGVVNDCHNESTAESMKAECYLAEYVNSIVFGKSDFWFWLIWTNNDFGL